VGTSCGNDLISTTLAATQYIHTSGRYLPGPCGDTLLLRGINYAPYNRGYDINSLEIGQISLTGSNVVRMVWYWNNPTYGLLPVSAPKSQLLLNDCNTGK